MAEDQVGVDPILDALERYLLGGPRTLTRLEVAARVGVSPDRSEKLWRALGFTRAEDDEVVFGYADVHALQIAQKLTESGVLDEEREASVARSLGRSFRRLAEWEGRLLAEAFATEGFTPEGALQTAETFVPLLEELHSYIWRRSAVLAVSRMLLRPVGEEGTTMAVGFCDIVGYTSQSRTLSETELEHLVETFESTSNNICTEHGGRIIKTIGDEVLFVADDPVAGARIALALVEEHLVNDAFPDVRCGVAYGPVLSRMGDVFGSVVNLASRLTTVARPARVLIDSRLQEQLGDSDEFVTRRMRRTSVKGFDRIEPFRLKRPSDRDEEHDNRLRRRATEFREVVDDLSPDVVRRRRS